VPAGEESCQAAGKERDRSGVNSYVTTPDALLQNPPLDGGRSVIGAAFEIMEEVGRLEPVRLMDLAQTTGIPRSTVHRLLQQLIEVGAVRRDGTRYRLGVTLLGLGEQVAANSRLRAVARRPMAELAAATGAAVVLSATIGEQAVYLDVVDARVPLGHTAVPGSPLAPRSAQARAHREAGSTPIVESGKVLPNVSCIAVPVPLGGGELAVVTTVATGLRPSASLLAATRSVAARIAGQVRTPTRDQRLHRESPLTGRSFARAESDS
jgi:DNA-binding IclR family transcriptional regulator